MSLVDDGLLGLGTTARSLLGARPAARRRRVTVEHLLASVRHRDYFDEETIDDVTDYVLPVPVQQLAPPCSTWRSSAGTRPPFRRASGFTYCNGGYVVLALLAERATGVMFHDLVRAGVRPVRVCGSTEFLRSDELPGRAATGYLTVDGPGATCFHLPVRGSGDGGSLLDSG